MQIHFWTNDIDRAVRFYTEALGFTLIYSQPDNGPTDFCILQLSDQEVMFGIPPVKLAALDRPDKRLMEMVITRLGQNGPLSIYFAVPDVEAHYSQAVAQGAEILEPLWQTPWGLKQYSLRDMDGQLLTFHSE
ncbi:MAG: VOC family protein [Ardenticatenaceae bacterium]|nr:VOC family protein [Ardenticatenaceae bacterium]